jgi:hypothetical protein
VSAVGKLGTLLAGYRERAYADEWDNWEDPATAHDERRVLLVANSFGVLEDVIVDANRKIEYGQLELPMGTQP